MDKTAKAAELQVTLRSNLEEIERMEVLINNLLLLSSMEAGKLRNEFTRLSNMDIVRDAVNTVSKFARAKNITLQTNLSDDSLLADRASLSQLYVILLENAIKYSPVDSSVDIKSKLNRSNIEVTIIDHGVGIQSSSLPHVFDRFYRADDARTRDISFTSINDSSGEPQGFGLGLSLAKLIADLHNGEIILSSTPGHGTTASVVLPALALKNK